MFQKIQNNQDTMEGSTAEILHQSSCAGVCAAPYMHHTLC